MRWCQRAIGLTMVAMPFLNGCAVNNKDILHFLREHEHEVSAIEYRVGIPDMVAISAPQVLEIEGAVQQIQPDGKITLRLLGDVKITGMTAKEIAAKLEVLLGRYYTDPKVAVRVVGYASKKYYVSGQATTGPRIYTGRDTLLDAVVESGINFMSWTSRVRVVRPTHDETPARTITVNVDNMIQQGDWSANILLEPDDIVYIPPTPLAWIGLRIQELLHPVAPVIQAYETPLELRYANDTYNNRSNGSFNTTSSSSFR